MIDRAIEAPTQQSTGINSGLGSSSFSGRTADVLDLGLPYPVAGEVLLVVQEEWRLVEAGEAQATDDLPRPWDPATCTSPVLHHELDQWLGDVVNWHNTHCVWDPAARIPTCWRQHPHLVRDIAILADQGRKAHHEPSSDGLERWHRTTVTAFTDRMRSALRQHCSGGHQPSPGNP